MEKEKTLDFSVPLLSVRRHSSTFPSSDQIGQNITEKSQPDREHSLPVERSDWELEEVVKRATVPFQWERTPGRPKGECRTHSSEEPSFTPRLPPGRLPYGSTKLGEVSLEQTVNKPQPQALAFNDHPSLLESLKEKLYGKGESDKESGEDLFSDARDTLSPPESLSLNCSASDLSGSCGQSHKSSGTFSIDPQTRNFMLSRFLPAAKAAVFEKPLYVPRKQDMVTEQPNLVNKINSAEREPLLEQHESDIISFYDQYIEDIKSEDGEDDHDDTGKRRSKTCGFLPRIRMRNSRSLSNPGPGTKLRSQPLTLGAEVKRLKRNAYIGPLDKGAYDAIYKRKYHSGALEQELHKFEDKWTNEPKRISYSSDSYKMEGLSPCRHPRSGGISPYRPSSFREEARFLGLPKEIELKDDKIGLFIKRDNNFHAVHSKLSYGQGPESDTTLDSSKAEKPVNSSSRKLTAMEENRVVGKYLSPKSSGQDVILVKSGSLETVSPSSTFVTRPKRLTDKMENLNLNLDFDQGKQSLGITKLHPDKSATTTKKHDVKPDEQKHSSAAGLISTNPPPLPEIPSESWLWRTLPSISLRNPFSHSHGSHFRSRRHRHQNNTGKQWENMVRSTNVHHDHIRFSEELLSHTPHQQHKP